MIRIKIAQLQNASARQEPSDGGLLMGDGACTVAPSFTLRVTIGAFTRPRYQWCEVAVGHGMVTRRVSEAAAE